MPYDILKQTLGQMAGRNMYEKTQLGKQEIINKELSNKLLSEELKMMLPLRMQKLSEEINFLTMTDERQAKAVQAQRDLEEYKGELQQTIENQRIKQADKLASDKRRHDINMLNKEKEWDKEIRAVGTTHTTISTPTPAQPKYEPRPTGEQVRNNIVMIKNIFEENKGAVKKILGDTFTSSKYLFWDETDPEKMVTQIATLPQEKIQKLATELKMPNLLNLVHVIRQHAGVDNPDVLGGNPQPELETLEGF